ncbi:MAG: hypothetical protein AB4911_23860 [Oscillochloridaceae bacterium umkhey_bin13]
MQTENRWQAVRLRDEQTVAAALARVDRTNFVTLHERLDQIATTATLNDAQVSNLIERARKLVRTTDELLTRH